MRISIPIAALLERHNVIDSPFVFSTAVRFFYEAEDKLKAGEYLFQASSSMKQVLDDLLSGRSVLHSITFPEGLTSQAIVDRLKADETLTGAIANVPAGRFADAGHLQVHSRRDPPADARPDADGADAPR